MEWLKFANDTEKIEALSKHVKEKIGRLELEIRELEAWRSNKFDYEWEIKEKRERISILEEILKIVDADFNTSILVL